MRFSLAMPACALALGCSTSATSPNVSEGGAPGDAAVDSADAAPPDPLAGCTVDPGAGDPKIPGDGGVDDPTGGPEKFTLAQALAGFPDGSGVLTAVITTEKGTIVCKLAEKEAPVTVANFIGLARGTRPSQDSLGNWKRKRFYDGLTWHRVIPDFVIQGGDPNGNGSGGPGYDLPNENHLPQVEGVLSEAAGVRVEDAGTSDAGDGGPGVSTFVPGGSQFYVVVGRGPKSDYNVFGSCTTDVAKMIAQVPRRAGDRPTVPIHMTKIDIGRCPR